MEFEYDSAKSETNLATHGIDFETAQRMWGQLENRDPHRTQPGQRRRALHRARHDRRQALDHDRHQAGPTHTNHLRAQIQKKRGGIL